MKHSGRYNYSRRKSFGFTLIEILVVLVLLGLISGIAVVSIGMNNQSRELENEIRRLHALMRLASDDAVLQNIELGFYIDSDGYEFLTYDDETSLWQQFGSAELRPREFPEWISIELWREEDQKELPSPEDGLNDDDEKKPLIVFLSSGESTEFKLRFFIDGQENTAMVIESDSYNPIKLVTPKSDEGEF